MNDMHKAVRPSCLRQGKVPYFSTEYLVHTSVLRRYCSSTLAPLHDQCRAAPRSPACPGRLDERAIEVGVSVVLEMTVHLPMI